ncbi:hypothetical protein YC2023_101769 [Brassica napus]
MISIPILFSHLNLCDQYLWLQNRLHTTTIVEKCTLKLVDDYKHMLCQATEPMSTFLEYIRAIASLLMRHVSDMWVPFLMGVKKCQACDPNPGY